MNKDKTNIPLDEPYPSRHPNAIWINDYGATMTYAKWSEVYAGCEMDAVCVANWRYSGKRMPEDLSP